MFGLRKFLSAMELAIFLVAVPLLVLGQQNYMFRRALLLLGGIYALLRLSNKVCWRRLFAKPLPGWWQGPCLRASLALVLIGSYILLFEPQNLFNLPKQHFLLWLLFISLYPIFSVLPQELVYRVYIFEVHKNLLNTPLAAILLSSLLFAWVHIVFAGWLGVAACMLAGLALGYNYATNRSKKGAIWPLILEHSLYGEMIFTLGLWQYFYYPRT